jgi:hypothetical protein
VLGKLPRKKIRRLLAHGSSWRKLQSQSLRSLNPRTLARMNAVLTRLMRQAKKVTVKS